MKKSILGFVLIIQILMLSLGVGVLSFDLSNNISGAKASEQIMASAVIKTEAPADLEELQQASDEQLEAWANLEKFDGREYDYVTPQKSQSGNTCWAYAATGLAEVSILREGIAPPEYNKNNLDFDDLHVAWASKNIDKTGNPLNLMKDDISDFDVEWYDGGYLYDALYSMTDGYSPILQQEEDDFKKSIPSEYIAEQVIRIDPSKEEIKKAILKYGAVGFSYEPGTYMGYMCSKTERTTHVSVIVGWDDSIPKENFKPDTPEENGAWIVKNSWGTTGAVSTVGGIGASYMSYEAYIGYRFAVDMGLKEDYPNIYQYDGSSVNSTSKVSYIEANAAIYEAKLSDPTKEEYLKAIQVGFTTQDVNLNIDIYRLENVNPANVNDKTNDPTKGTKIYNKTIYFKKDGFFTIKLDKKILLNQGEYFSIVLYDTGHKDLRVMSGIDATSTNDMTFYRIKNESGKSEWRNYKYSTSFDYANKADIGHTARIRAITETRKRETTLDEHDLQYARIEVDDNLKVYQKDVEQKPSITVSIGDEKLKENQDYSVKVAENNIKPGTVKVTITGIYPYHGSRTTMFEIAKLYYPDNVPESTMTVYNNVTTLADIPLPEGWEWLGGDNDTIPAGQTTTFTIKYTADDHDCYINNMFDIRITKLNENPPDRISLATANIVVNGKYTYNGQPIIPNLTVTLNGTNLQKEKDYTLKCDNNTNAGTADITITGNGLYEGEAHQTFVIQKAAQPKNRPESTRTISRRITTLAEVKLPTDWIWENPGLTISSDSFTATAVYNGLDKDNYDTIEMQIEITRAAKVNISTIDKLIVEDILYVYNGHDITPSVIAVDGNYMLNLNTDFSVEYQNNTNAGQGKIIVSGIGEFYTGEKILTFQIAKANRNGFSVDIVGWIYGESANKPTYTGNEASVNIKEEYSTSKNGTYSETVPKDAGTYWVKATIPESQNYNEAVAYKQFTISKAAGIMTATIDSWTFGKNSNFPTISSSTNSINNPTITYRKVGEEQFTSAVPKNAGQYQMKIVLPASQNYNSCEKILTFSILKATKPIDIPQAIKASKYAKKLGDIKLPTGWEWENPSLEITEDMVAARIVRIDANNYEQSAFEIKLNFVDEPDQPTDETIDASVLWWGLGIIGGTAIIGIVWWLISKRKKKWWKIK